MNLNQRNEKMIELHNFLNSKNCPNDIDDQLVALFKQNEQLVNNSQQILTPAELQGKNIELHDSYVENFSEKKQLNHYITTFKANAYVYDHKNYIGTIEIKFEIISNNKLREISNKEIFDFVINDTAKQLSIVYHTNPSTYHTGPNSHLVSLVHDYTSLKVEHSPFEPYISQHKKVSI